jgi:hypothetical protein
MWQHNSFKLSLLIISVQQVQQLPGFALRDNNRGKWVTTSFNITSVSFAVHQARCFERSPVSLAELLLLPSYPSVCLTAVPCCSIESASFFA